MELFYIAVAFVLGFAVRSLGQPPLVGFLAAGFALHATGFETTPLISGVSDIGVQLLLFTIGVKLDLRSLLRPVVCIAGTLHLIATVAVMSAICGVLDWVAFTHFDGLDFPGALLLGFALSFSSTVFAVKMLERGGASRTVYGRIAIGILILQDIAAVLFLTASKGEWPSLWALPLVASLPLVSRAVGRLLDHVGHGELMVLLGILLAGGGVATFEAVGLKGDLGALIAGVVVGSHGRGSDLARTLMGFKELFLVGFFLEIGLMGLPDPDVIGVAAFLLLFIPVKVGLYFVALTRFRARARTGLLTSLTLASYSEFGLIVNSVAVSAGWLDPTWLIIDAMAVALSFALAAPLAVHAESIYRRLHDGLRSCETGLRLPEEEPVDTGDAQVLILGMGRVGTGAYDEMRRRHGELVLAADSDPAVVEEHRTTGRRVILADATDSDFWRRVHAGGLRVAMLALPRVEANEAAAEQLHASAFGGVIAAVYKYRDEAERLEAAGVNSAKNLYEEAGEGFADFVCNSLGSPAFQQLEPDA